MQLIEPKEVTIDDRAFIISKFPAVAGREIVALYPQSALPKLGDYHVNEATMFKLMCYVGVQKGDSLIRLSSRELIDNHVKDWEMLLKIEAAMAEYNCSFFQNGRVSTFLRDTAQNIPQYLSKILTDLSALSSQKEKRPSTN